MNNRDKKTVRTGNNFVVMGVLEKFRKRLGPVSIERFGVRTEDGDIVMIHLDGEGYDGPTLRALRGTYCEAIGVSKGTTMIILEALKIYQLHETEIRSA